MNLLWILAAVYAVVMVLLGLAAVIIMMAKSRRPRPGEHASEVDS